MNFHHPDNHPVRKYPAHKYPADILLPDIDPADTPAVHSVLSPAEHQALLCCYVPCRNIPEENLQDCHTSMYMYPVCVRSHSPPEKGDHLYNEWLRHGSGLHRSLHCPVSAVPVQLLRLRSRLPVHMPAA